LIFIEKNKKKIQFLNVYKKLKKCKNILKIIIRIENAIICLFGIHFKYLR